MVQASERELDPPEIFFARSDGVAIAWHAWGDGVPVLIVPPLAQNIDVMWEQRAFSRPLRRMGTFARLASFDKRGTGLSDPVDGPVPMEVRMRDILAVLDAAGFEKAYLMGLSEGGPMSLMFASLFPERVAGLVLAATGAGDWFAPELADHAEGLPPLHTPENRIEFWGEMIAGWGTAESRLLDEFAPSMAHDDRLRAWAPRYQRSAASQAMFAELVTMVAMLDVSHVLPSITCPVLVVHEVGDRVIHASNGRYLAARLPQAIYREFPGEDHFVWMSPHADDLIDEMERFLTGEEPRPKARDRPDRWSTLTSSERRVVELVRRGLTNSEIAETLVLSKRTVENHLHRSYAKLGVSGRTDLLLLPLHKNL